MATPSRDHGFRTPEDAWFRSLAERFAIALFIYRKGRLVYVNPATAHLTGYPIADLLQMGPRHIVHPDDWPVVLELERELRHSGSPGWIEFRIVRADGTVRWVTYSVTTMESAGAAVAVGTAVDTTRRAEAERSLREYREWLEMAQRAGRSLAWEWHRGDDRLIVAGSPEEVYGTDSSSIPRTGTELLRAIPAEDVSIIQGAIRESARTGRPFAVEHRLSLGPRDHRWITVRGQAFLGPDGRLARVAGVSADVTDRKRAESERNYYATHDPLTGLLNRREFERRLGAAVSRARRGGPPHALCYVDLDDFKVVNDICGHAAGDQLLRGLASALVSSLPPEDAVGRLGGDEFGALLADCPPAEARRRAEHLLEAVRNYGFTWDGQVFEVGASIGIVTIDGSSGEPQDLLRAADNACYVAKNRGRNRIHVWQPDDAEVRDRTLQAAWIQRLKAALAAGSFRLLAQPIVPLQGGNRPAMVEILLRLEEPGGRTVPPAEFIPAAERAQLMASIDRWVVHTALQGLLRTGFPSAGEESLVTLNLSGQSLSDPSFMEAMEQEIQGTGIPAHRICFEITETAAISDLAGARSFMQRLREIGCRFILDDFGRGLSSFTYLRTLPVQYLKIDGDLVRDIPRDPVRREMVLAIHRIGRAMDLTTIGESVESGATLELLREMGIDYAQGFHTGRPRPFVAPWDGGPGPGD